MRWLAAILLALVMFGCAPDKGKDGITIGSKKFTESVILGEMGRNAVARTGRTVTHRRELGGSRILWDALKAGEIDVYPEYTGTLRFEILSGEKLADDTKLPAALARHGIAMTRPLGFSNGYALAMRRDRADELGIETIGDLLHNGELDIAVSNEFVDRGDGWRALAAAYDLEGVRVRGIDHDLAYRAVQSREIDVTDAYTTDAEIAAYDLKLLRDDRAFFPRYDAVLLYRADLPADAAAALQALAGKVTEQRMRDLNRSVRIDRQSEESAAAEVISPGEVEAATGAPDRWQELGQRTLEHIWLVAVALALAIAVAVPLGIVAARNRRLGALVLSASGVLQTIPSLALLVMLIPLLGIGTVPTIAALFVYSLLPIVRNTHAGLTGIDPRLIDSARALGLSGAARLRRVELPLALPTILAGVRTAAVIAVGLATLGALIGAGGLGQPILTGIRLNDTRQILEGAIGAALLALAMEGLFHLLEKRLIPRGLRL